MPSATLDRIKQRRFRNPAEAAFVRLVLVGEHLTTELDALCARFGLTHSQYNVLRILRGVYPDGHPRFEIANRLMHRAPDVTRLLDRLARQGLVSRGVGPANRRESIATITPAGLAQLDAIQPELDTLQRQAFASLSSTQLRQLRELLDHVVPR